MSKMKDIRMVEFWIHQQNITALLLTCIFVVVLIFAAVSDIRTRTIPDRYSAAILLVALVSVFCVRELPVSSRLTGIFCVSVPMLLLTAVYPGAFGGGDIKLMAACGAFLGWKNMILAFGIAILAGGVAGAALLLTKQKSRKEQFVFGPFLCTGLIVALLWGSRLWEWLGR